MIRRINHTKVPAKVGYLVSIDPNNYDAFVYTTPNSTKSIGVVTEVSAYRKPCNVATLGDTTKVYVMGNVNKGDILRSAKTTDRASLGVCVIAKSGDAPYLRVGEALESGSGLIKCILDLQYVSGSSVSAVADGNYVVGLGMLTDGIITISGGIITAIQEAT